MRPTTAACLAHTRRVGFIVTLALTSGAVTSQVSADPLPIVHAGLSVRDVRDAIGIHFDSADDRSDVFLALEKSSIFSDAIMGRAVVLGSVGDLSVFAEARNMDGLNDIVEAVATASWRDLLRIDAGPPGTPRTWTYQVNVHGEFQTDAVDTADDDFGISTLAIAGFFLGATGGLHFETSQARDWQFGLLREGNIRPSLEVTIPVFSGVPFEFGVVASASTRFYSDTGGRGFARSAFSQTIRWGGTLGVFDVLGNPVAYTITPESGFDYTRPFSDGGPPPVPEPASLLLLGTGVAGFLIRRRA